MARWKKKEKRKPRGRQPRCWVCHKIATIRRVAEDEDSYTVEHYSVPRFIPEYGEFRMVVVCSQECGDQVQAENTAASRDLKRKVARESPLAMTLTMLDLLKEDR